MIKLNVVVGTYNEEFMLNHWLKHHKNIFDHGIVLDYKSTDSTLDLIKTIVPNWEVITAKNYQYFDAEINDKEIMECEEKLNGWKICLNTTEFIVCSDFREKVQKLDNTNYDMVRLFGYQINDTVEEKLNKTFNNNKSIITQRYHGFPDPWRHRILHKKNHGHYYVGRHFDTPKNKKSPYVKDYPDHIPIMHNMILFWYRFAPFYPQLKRKIQASPRIPERDKKLGYSWNHIDLNEKKIEERWAKEVPKCKNLLENDFIKKEIEKIENKMKHIKFI